MPIKLHNRRLSLSRAFFLPIKLEVYLNPQGQALGKIFFDDGVSFAYKNSNRYILMKLSFKSNVLSVEFNKDRTFIEEAYYVQITQISIYNNAKGCPKGVLERN